eukprot:CAMPEP_0179053720 /NCGR_PEP_ID=MMETSP0796-20121207/22419_1 /TAXON_ID=73915 /ORGANISM="Pyrodinium bahamense, Strain pbaha01" /LENGTH=134 /DNA_ID=CAMNT_0020750327 /DNA_START=15 /DNA_END=416 /DNA_ORIENTATION=-
MSGARLRVVQLWQGLLRTHGHRHMRAPMALWAKACGETCGTRGQTALQALAKRVRHSVLLLPQFTVCCRGNACADPTLGETRVCTAAGRAWTRPSEKAMEKGACRGAAGQGRQTVPCLPRAMGRGIPTPWLSLL